LRKHASRLWPPLIFSPRAELPRRPHGPRQSKQASERASASTPPILRVAHKCMVQRHTCTNVRLKLVSCMRPPAVGCVARSTNRSSNPNEIGPSGVGGGDGGACTTFSTTEERAVPTHIISATVSDQVLPIVTGECRLGDKHSDVAVVVHTEPSQTETMLLLARGDRVGIRRAPHVCSGLGLLDGRGTANRGLPPVTRWQRARLECIRLRSLIELF
jgi:hypothetical protein